MVITPENVMTILGRSNNTISYKENVVCKMDVILSQLPYLNLLSITDNFEIQDFLSML